MHTNTIEFKYDNAGNLDSQGPIAEEIESLSAKVPDPESLLTATDGTYTVAVGPSPTDGQLVVKVNFDGEYHVHVTNTVYGNTQEFTLTGEESALDISNFRVGIYILVFLLKDENGGVHTLNLKVVKK